MVLVFSCALTDQASYQAYGTDPHFTDEKTEAAGPEEIARGHLAAERWPGAERLSGH